MIIILTGGTRLMRDLVACVIRCDQPDVEIRAVASLAGLAETQDKAGAASLVVALESRGGVDDRALRALARLIPVVVVSGSRDCALAAAARRADRHVVVTLDDTGAALAAAVRRFVWPQPPVAPCSTHPIAANIERNCSAADCAQHLGLISRREAEVLALLVQGRANKEIAHALDIEVVTVKRHVGRLLSKLGARNRTQVATTALSLGLVSHRSGPLGVAAPSAFHLLPAPRAVSSETHLAHC